MKGYVFFANLQTKNSGGLRFGTSDKELEQGLLELKDDKLKFGKLKVELQKYSKANGTFINYFEVE